MKWAIGVYSGPGPFELTPPACVSNPVLSAEDVEDIRAGAVADPFLLRRSDTWYLAFEALNKRNGRGEIAFATSSDGFEWKYTGVALREPFHLSYPYLFEADGAVYMIPETRQANGIRLYRAHEFPWRWVCLREILQGSYADASIIQYHGLWWLFAHRGLDETRLFWSAELESGWREHPVSPLWPGNRTYSRPGGRILLHGGRLFRFVQDGSLNYGHSLRVLEVDLLNEREFIEHELESSPLLAASQQGWNASGMHHIDVQPARGDGWIAMVDGANLGFH
jgi:hypothetical protein